MNIFVHSLTCVTDPCAEDIPLMFMVDYDYLRLFFYYHRAYLLAVIVCKKIQIFRINMKPVCTKLYLPYRLLSRYIKYGVVLP